MTFQFNDGGRSEHFDGEARDCVYRSIAIATGKPYLEVYNELNQLAQSERITKRRRWSGRSSATTGVYRETVKRYLLSLGWKFTPTMGIGTGCRVHLRAEELPTGRLIVRCSKHLTAVIDGVINDTFDPSREGTRCVYGYFQKRGSIANHA